jgi:hypothetical protein
MDIPLRAFISSDWENIDKACNEPTLKENDFVWVGFAGEWP